MNNHNLYPFISSILLHLFFIYLFFFGMPPLFRELPEEKVVIIDLVPVKNFSNIKTQKPQTEPAVESPNSKKVMKSSSHSPAAKQNTKQASDKKTVEFTKKKIENNKNKISGEENNKIVHKKKSIKIGEDPEDKNLDNELNNLLQTLENTSEERGNAKETKVSQTKQTSAVKKESIGNNYDENLELAIEEKILIKSQLEEHWNIPSGARNINQVKVTLLITLKIDGSVEDIKIISKHFCQPDNFCTALLDSIFRSINNASPIKGLSPSRYNYWREIKYRFKPPID